MRPNNSYLKIRTYEELEKIANGQVTKLIVPSDIQNLTSKVAEIKEVLDVKN